MMLGSASPRTSLFSGDGTLPHSRSLVADDIPPSAVLQAVPTSGIAVVEVVAEQSWLITKLTVQLLWALRMSARWTVCAARLIWFVALLLPAFLRMFAYWLLDPNIHKNIIYGLNARNLLDVYVPPKLAAHSKTSDSAPTSPVVVFITGGAWIIGYKAWGALMGRVLSCFGVVVVMPDYRNFPQGILPDMVEDATRALQWVFDNIHLFGGDRDNVTLIGQSAGAHISMCALLEQVERKEQMNRSRRWSRSSSVSSGTGALPLTSDHEMLLRSNSNCSNLSVTSVESVESAFTRPPTWELKQIRSYIGISGPYNMEASLATFHRHGFDKGVVERIMAHRLAYYSPSLRLLAKSELREYSHALDDFPPVYLFHGTADKTVSWQSTEQLTHALEACKIPVKTRFFEGKTHTDPILEDPFSGDEFLVDEIIAIMKERSPVDPTTGRSVFSFGEMTSTRWWYPSLLVKVARRVNPF
jgi:prenylcysteine alpha-carboxyl methylesterase